MIVMDIKIILLSVVMAHMCTATNNDHTFSRFNDSGHINSPFGFINQTIQMFNRNDNAMTYNNYTFPYNGILITEHDVALVIQNLTFRRIIPSIYIFIILISLPLNALALVTFTCKIPVKNPAVIYMSHLACVDLLFTLLLPLKIHYHLNADWVFGEVACRVLTVAYYCNMYCSILLMMYISVDRMLAIALPVASLNWRSTRNATWVCVLVWLLAIAGTVPLLSMRQTFNIQIGMSCFDIFENISKLLFLSVFLILPCIYFFLPLVVILVSYSTIIYVLCAKRNNLATSSSSSDNRRRAVIMATAVLIEFVVCFGPSNAFLLNHCVSLAMGSNGTDTYPAYLLAVCLGSTSVFLDPLLYYYGSSQYRQLITSVFWGKKGQKH